MTPTAGIPCSATSVDWGPGAVPLSLTNYGIWVYITGSGHTIDDTQTITTPDCSAGTPPPPPPGTPPPGTPPGNAPVSFTPPTITRGQTTVLSCPACGQGIYSCTGDLGNGSINGQVTLAPTVSQDCTVTGNNGSGSAHVQVNQPVNNFHEVPPVE
ncbi:MAG: hypothetical protein HY220_02660 [Candidatus Sungbacteria bacterium]|uniref:Uncharacterized protein n=1 Tax=Candidatus Sungiibacteriota bacterium TaxID=2750080 RepID=A0A9D6QTY3_9BACT|nr:hypothetical protein [Candidatus Sungbacteria bacterium]